LRRLFVAVCGSFGLSSSAASKIDRLADIEGE
jgi:hypothetical protein